MIRVVPAGIDLALVLIFAIVGRASHTEGLGLVGIAQTAWPFLVACLFAWIVVALRNDDGFDWRSGLIVWLVTVVGGLGLRILGGDGAAWPFVIVATTFLAAVLFGWRLAWRFASRRRHQPAAA